MADSRQIFDLCNDFGHDFLKKFSKQLPNEKSLFYSGPSIFTAFAMLAEGAANDSLKELNQLLKLDNLDNVSGHFQTLVTSLKHKELNKSELNFANFLVLNEEYLVRREFKTVLKKFYGSEVEEMNFSAQAKKSTNKMNSWVKHETGGKIEKIFEDPISADTVLVILNAIYFRGLWSTPFESENTRKDTFYGQEEREIDFMAKEFEIQHSQFDDQATLVRLPYEGKASMLVLIPHDKKGLDKLVDTLDTVKLNESIKSLAKSRAQNTVLYLPKFKLEQTIDLKQALSSMGLSEIFDESKADLSGITGSPGPFVSRAIHKSMLEVDEKGTTAAAVTAIEGCIESCMLLPDPYLIKVDRPFLLIIRDDRYDLNLFMGVVRDI